MTITESPNVHYMAKTFEWATPQDLFNKLDAEFDFTVDVASTHANAKLSKHYTIEDDGLAQSWDGETVWCNPPYGRQITAWIRKALDSNATTVLLLPARTDTRWFHDLLKPNAEIRFLRGRLYFGETVNDRAPFPSLIGVIRTSQRGTP